MTASFHVLQQLFDTTRRYPQKLAVVLDEQSWTYGELIANIGCVVNHLHSLKMARGQVIYQYMDRGFEMVCGLFGILCADGVYCSINPTEPADRLANLLQQIQGQFVLLHGRTVHQFPPTTVRHMISLDAILHPLSCGENIEDLPSCSGHGAAYVICTSGTTGRQKLVVHTYKSFSAGDYILIQSNLQIFTAGDNVFQVASCSWTLHLTEISITLMIGGTLVLLRPGGHLDMRYFTDTFSRQQVTTLLVGPAIIHALTNYLEITQRRQTFMLLRRLCTAGD